MADSTSPQEQKKTGVIGSLKRKLDDKDEQLEIVSTFVKLGIIIWSGFIISLNYLPDNIFGKTEPKDITFIASIFTGALAGFNISTGKKKGEEVEVDEENKPLTRKEIQALLENQSSSYKTIRIEQPVKIIGLQPNISEKDEST